MAFFLQQRNLRKAVERQLQELEEGDEKGLNRQPPETERNRVTTSHEPFGNQAVSSSNTNGAISSDSEKKPGSQSPYLLLEGISLKRDHVGEEYYNVDWEGKDDPLNPKNWSTPIRLRSTLIIDLIAFVVTASSAIDSTVLKNASMEFGVAEVVESLATGIFLCGFGVGALPASSLSEFLGRYPVYLGSLSIFGCWLVGAALAPNIGAQLTFRFLAGFFASSPLTVAGGSLADCWNPKELTWAFSIFAIQGFGGPVLGPVIGSYIAYSPNINWRWTEWIMLIGDGLVIIIVLMFKQETMSPQLLYYKARHFRKLTGDNRFKTAIEASGKTSLGVILKTNFTRPFLFAIEPIVVAFTLYMTVVYIVLFTFLDGYEYIFEMTYHTNPGITFIIFVALFCGVLAAFVLVPIVWSYTKKQLARDGDDGTGTQLKQESRLLFAMIGGPAFPIGLFWMAWTDYSSVSIWSPIMSSALIGFGLISIFLSAYMYIIDSYKTYAASALTFVTLVRYEAAGENVIRKIAKTKE
ncbi:MAG: hypothetical protein Q9227_006541 [Pyrenula ochraceoflavens]